MPKEYSIYFCDPDWPSHESWPDDGSSILLPNIGNIRAVMNGLPDAKTAIAVADAWLNQIATNHNQQRGWYDPVVVFQMTPPQPKELFSWTVATGGIYGANVDNAERRLFCWVQVSGRKDIRYNPAMPVPPVNDPVNREYLNV